MANMFDENGNYNKTEWKPGDRIAAGKLNKIEDALEAINNNDIERHKEADERLDALEEQNEAVEERFDELEDLVADNKTEVEVLIYENNVKMDRLEQEMNDGIDTVEAIAHTVDDKIAEADASMKAQVNAVDDKIAEAHEVAEEMEGLLNETQAFTTNAKTEIGTATTNAKAEIGTATENGLIELEDLIKVFDMEEVYEYIKMHTKGLWINLSDFERYTDEIDDSPRIQRAIDYCVDNNLSLYIPSGTYRCDSTLSINSGITIKGASRENTILSFYNSSNTAFKIAETASVMNVYLGDLTVIGNPNIDAFVIGNTLNNNLVDSVFENIRTEYFNRGIYIEFSWDIRFTSCRFHNCNQHLVLSSQTNAIHFDTCQFSASSQANEFVNCEGVIFTNADFVNNTNDKVFTLYQSTVLFNNPYFENIPNILMSVGSTNSTIKSSVVINGGLVTGKIKLDEIGSSIIINGSRITKGFNLSNDVVPRMYSNNININLDDDICKNTLIYSYNGNIASGLIGAYGGLHPTHNLQRDCCWVTQSNASNGILLTSQLVVGQQYTLILCIRKQSDVSSVGLRMDNGNNMGINCLNNTDDWEIRYYPFVSNGTTLRLLFQGTIEVKMIKIFKGIVNSNLNIEEFDNWKARSIPSSGNWLIGDYIRNSNPSVGNPKGWVCVSGGNPGTWVSDANL